MQYLPLPRFLTLCAFSALVSACGGGGGGDAAPAPAPAPIADARNGEYKLFSTDANEYQLVIDFDTRRYSIKNGATTVVDNGSFTAGADGTYTFATTAGYNPALNNARFRVAHGLIVGSHPVGTGQALPFLAANSFVSAAADLPQTNMWLLASDVSPTATPAVNSRIQSIRLNGAQISYCSVTEGALTTVQDCLPANLSTQALTFNADKSVTWNDAGSPVRLHVARAGSELVLIRAQTYATTGSKRFQIALTDGTPLANGVYEGGVSNGSWGTTTLSADAFKRTALTSGNLADTVEGTWIPLYPNPRLAQGDDNVPYFVLNTPVLNATVAARNSDRAGQIAFGLKQP